MKRTCFVLVAIALLLATAGAQLPTATAVVGEQGRIYVAVNGSIVAMDPDGGNRAELPNGGGYDSAPSASADGSVIAFSRLADRNTTLWTMARDGSHQVAHPGASGGEISPDGTKVAFTYTPYGVIELKVIDLLTGAISTVFRQTWSRGDGTWHGMSWAADSNLISYVVADRSGSHLQFVNVDGSPTPARYYPPTCGDVWVQRPAYSQDGTKMFYVHTGDYLDPVTGECTYVARSIRVMDADGRNPHRVSGDLADLPDALAISPDGQHVLYDTPITGSQAKELVIVDVATGVARRLALPDGYSGDGFAWGKAAPRTCHGQVATIVGTTGADELSGTSKPDVIVGLGGDDVISGLGGNDTVCGDGGNDRLVGGPGDDGLLGGAGNDTVIGGAGVDSMYGGMGVDLLRANDSTFDKVINCGADTDKAAVVDYDDPSTVSCP